MKALGIAIALLLISATHAAAQVTEVRVGVGEFAQDFIDLGFQSSRNVENSVTLVGEVIFAGPDIFRWALSPQPYVNFGLNLEGNTSYAGAGLLWRQSFGRSFYGDFGFGLVIHDGTTEIDPNEIEGGDSIFAVVNELERARQFGSRVLFREQLSVGYRASETLSVEGFFEHISNGQILGRDPDPSNAVERATRNQNEGADTVGLRIAKRF